MPGVVDDDEAVFGAFNKGITLVHEAGHYFGLAHTFNANTCSGDNDGIPDTPIERSPASGCPVGRDSCPNQRGLDPIRNFMDYSDDGCMTSGFTGMQVRKTPPVYVYVCLDDLGAHERYEASFVFDAMIHI